MKTEFPGFAYTALILKLAGLLLILGVAVDFIVLMIPANFLDSNWLSNLLSEWVGRGTIPLIGLALILFGFWVEQRHESTLRGQATNRGGWFWTFALSGFLGLLFLILAPVYFRSNQLASASITREINEAAASAENQLDSELELRRNQVSALVGNQELAAQLQQQLQAADQLSSEEQAFLQEVQDTLEQVKDDPNVLDQKVEEARQQGLARIQEEQQQAITERTGSLRQSRIRVTLNSVLLAVGYLLIAVQGMGTSAARGKPKTQLRDQRQK